MDTYCDRNWAEEQRGHPPAEAHRQLPRTGNNPDRHFNERLEIGCIRPLRECPQDRLRCREMATFTVSTVIDAPPGRVWAALADIGSISVWNPGVKNSHLTSKLDAALGATRHCDLGGRNYLDEEVVEFVAGEALTMRITKTNLPFRHADIRFRLEPQEAATRVSVSPEYQLKFGPVGTLMDRLMVRRTYEKGMKALLRGLKRHVETDVAAG